MDLQVIYTNQINVIGKRTPRVLRENPTKARRSRRQPEQETALGFLNTGKRKKEVENAIQTKLGEESTVTEDRSSPSR